jgi:hypothetical protein
VREGFRFVLVTLSGLLLWEAANQVFGTREPWDSPHFWWAYLVALALSGVFGFVFDRKAWRWGLLMVLTLWPVMWLHTQGGPLIVLGLVVTLGLAVPTIATAVAFSAIRRKPAQ